MGNIQQPLPETDLIYGLNDKPPFVESLFAAIQHAVAMIVSIMTPALIICKSLNVSSEDTTYIVCMSLFISGVATFIQVHKFGPAGSGILSVQGTSYAFIGVIIAVGKIHLAKGSTIEDTLAVIFGLCLVGAFLEIIASRFIKAVKNIITPLVSGIVVTLIGATLISSAVSNCAGGQSLIDKYIAGQIPAETLQHNIILAFFVLVVILTLNCFANRWIRMFSIFAGLVAGYGAAYAFGLMSFSTMADTSLILLPVPFKYGFGFDLSSFLGFALLYLMTTVETIGDITATSMVSDEPVEGDIYLERVAGGVFGDGLNSVLAAVFGTFPNTTFSQNNGVIQLTGVASRHVGYFVAAILALLGLIPHIAKIAEMMPAPVLGGATFLMFGTVAASGIRIIASQKIDRRGSLILAISIAIGLGVSFKPELVKLAPDYLHSILGSGIITGGLSAIFLNFLLPSNTVVNTKIAK